VVWVNELPPRDFAAGFGSHTPLVVGQSRVARYGCMETRVTDKLRGRGGEGRSEEV
jgi:hypothetical protein